jgi:hypothetical protein
MTSQETNEAKRNIETGYYIIRVPFPDEGLWTYLTVTSHSGEMLLRKFYDITMANKIAAQYTGAQVIFKEL